MKLRTAFDDFMQGTLAALPNLWQKLEFLGSLRTADGGYEHWGMTYVYGEAKAEETMRRSHTEVFLQLLATPLDRLFEEAANSESESGGMALRHFGEYQHNSKLLPPDLDGGDVQHFQFILRTLALLSARASARHRAA